jgi:hypothetical protein
MLLSSQLNSTDLLHICDSFLLIVREWPFKIWWWWGHFFQIFCRQATVKNILTWKMHKKNKSLQFNTASKWKSDHCLMSVEPFLSCIMAKTSYILMRWWCLLCTRSTCLAWFLLSASSLIQKSMGRHVAPLGHIIMIPSQPIFALTP